jgi:hypothetical protein
MCENVARSLVNTYAALPWVGFELASDVLDRGAFAPRGPTEVAVRAWSQSVGELPHGLFWMMDTPFNAAVQTFV